MSKIANIMHYIITSAIITYLLLKIEILTGWTGYNNVTIVICSYVIMIGIMSVLQYYLNILLVCISKYKLDIKIEICKRKRF